MTARTRLSLTGVGIVLLLAYPAIYAGMYAGDAEIHLIFAENAAEGGFFEFNEDEKSSGVTSPGYMLLLATFFKLAPAPAVPVIVKAINYVAWYALVLLVYLSARRILDSVEWGFLAALVSGLLPGSAFNSTIGMENGLFAAAVLLFIYLVVRWRWLRAVTPQERRHGFAIGVALGTAAWLRPEGIAVGSIALAYAALTLRKDRLSIAGIVSRLAVPCATFAALTLAMMLFHLWGTGDWLPASGVSRAILSRSEAIELAGFSFTPKFSERLLYYAPLTGAALLGGTLLLTRRIESESKVELLLIVLFCMFFAMYSTVLGSFHLSRYVIFLMPMLVIVGAIGAKWLWYVLPPRVQWLKLSVFVLGTAGLITIFATETGLRRNLGAHDGLAQAIAAPGMRTEFSDNMMSQLGNPTDLPVSLAYQEVQARYRLDDRFVIRSLDGRVDKKLLDYIEDSHYDHLGYVRERRVDFIMETVNYNRDRGEWSLSRLDELAVGAELERDGIVLRRVPNGRYAVVSIDQ